MSAFYGFPELCLLNYFAAVFPKLVFRVFGTIPDQFWIILKHFWTEAAYNIIAITNHIKTFTPIP